MEYTLKGKPVLFARLNPDLGAFDIRDVDKLGPSCAFLHLYQGLQDLRYEQVVPYFGQGDILRRTRRHNSAILGIIMRIWQTQG